MIGRAVSEPPDVGRLHDLVALGIVLLQGVLGLFEAGDAEVDLLVDAHRRR